MPYLEVASWLFQCSAAGPGRRRQQQSLAHLAGPPLQINAESGLPLLGLQPWQFNCPGVTASLSTGAAPPAGRRGSDRLGVNVNWAPRAAARARPNLNFKLPLVSRCWARNGCNGPGRLRIGSQWAGKFKSRALQFEITYTWRARFNAALGFLLFRSAHSVIFIQLVFNLFYSILVLISNISSTTAVLEAKYFQPFVSDQVLLFNLLFISAGDSSRNFV